ncbi:MAG: IS1634 family transposase, partial [Syntrophomonadaceae bacterium]|nr:IS1634 family transposase [Syntrophomonadaceae bacterium]
EICQWRSVMFLKRATKTFKGKVYESYALTESYREDGKVKHRNIWNLGSLTGEQAHRIRLILTATQNEDMFVGRLSDVVAKTHYRFLDIALLHHFWQYWGLDDFFADQPLAEVMSINRCLDPKSKFQVNAWVLETVLPRLLHLDPESDEYAIYRALDQIAIAEGDLQSFLYRKLQELGLDGGQAVFYDITSTYFEGTKCILARFGYSRDKRPDRVQVTIALVVTPNGYPFYWRVMEGNTPDMATVSELLKDLRQRFGITECLLVFDRGMVSEDNLLAISGQELKFVTAISRDEIPGLNILDPDLALCLTLDNWRRELSLAGFIPYDQNLLYREHKLGDRRYILAFNPELFLEQQETCQQHYQKAEEFITQLNTELHLAKKSRDPENVQKQIEVRLKKLKMHKVFAWQLLPVNLSCKTKSGKEKTVQSFKIEYQIDQEALNWQNWLNGFLCFVTNQPAENLSPGEVISYYRRKNKIEEAFREIKHYLKLRPVFVTREKRVKAHVVICVLGYLLLNTLDEKLNDCSDTRSAVQVLELMGKCLLNRIGLKGDAKYSESITLVTENQRETLAALGCSYLVAKKFLEPLLANSNM